MSTDLRERLERILHARNCTGNHTNPGGCVALADALLPVVQDEITRAERRVASRLASDAERAVRQVRRLHERYRFAGDDSTD